MNEYVKENESILNQNKTKIYNLIESYKKTFLALIVLITLIMGSVNYFFLQISSISYFHQSTLGQKQFNKYSEIYFMSEITLAGLLFAIITVQFINETKSAFEIFNSKLLDEASERKKNIKKAKGYSNKFIYSGDSQRVVLNALKLETALYKIYIVVFVVTLLAIPALNFCYYSSALVDKNYLFFNKNIT